MFFVEKTRGYAIGVVSPQLRSKIMTDAEISWNVVASGEYYEVSRKRFWQLSARRLMAIGCRL
jgi:hypothetical protein